MFNLLKVHIINRILRILLKPDSDKSLNKLTILRFNVQSIKT